LLAIGVVFETRYGPVQDFRQCSKRSAVMQKKVIKAMQKANQGKDTRAKDIK
jgi:hypothetical protein